jgi:hypothetical protein
MSERKRSLEIENASIRRRSLEERLKDLPEVRARFEGMLDLIENAAGDVEKAAEAERRVIEELRQMGNEILHSWARRQEQKKEEGFNKKPGVNRKKKNSLLVHAVRKNRNSGADLYPGTSRFSDPAVFGLRRGRVSRLLDTIAAGDHRLRCRRFVCGSVSEAKRALWDRRSGERDPSHYRKTR